MINKILINAILLDVKFVWDYCQIFTNVGTINIYNPISCELKERTFSLSECFEADILRHQIVEENYFKEKCYELLLDNECKIIISLLEEDYNSPEAVSIYLNNGKIIVLE